ncbi:MAG: metallophosphoesterase [Chloroflexota bacterium]
MLRELRRILSSSWKPLALAGGLALLDAYWEPRQLRLNRVTVPVDPRWERLAGLRLAQLSDLHVGGRGWRPATIARAIEACNRADVQMVAITGDLISSVEGAFTVLEMLSELRADVPRLAVLGNHDHVHGGRPLRTLLQGLESLGIVVLRNQVLPLDLPLGRVWLAGVDDGYSMRGDLAAVRTALEDDVAPRLLLTHYPDVADWLRPGEFQLSLAGHSHGGQIRLPLVTSMVHNGHARTKYASGLYRVNGNPLYVSSGLGTSGAPLRFRNWPEVAMIEFARGSGATPYQTTGSSIGRQSGHSALV